MYSCDHCNKNDDNCHKGREGRDQRVMIEIIICENDDNDGRPLRKLDMNCGNSTSTYIFYIQKIAYKIGPE